MESRECFLGGFVDRCGEMWPVGPSLADSGFRNRCAGGARKSLALLAGPFGSAQGRLANAPVPTWSVHGLQVVFWAFESGGYFSSFIALHTSVVWPVFESITVVAGRQLQVTVLAFSCLTTTQCSMRSAVGGGNWLRMGGGVGATGCFFAAQPARNRQSTNPTFLMPSVFARGRPLVDGKLGYLGDTGQSRVSQNSRFASVCTRGGNWLASLAGRTNASLPTRASSLT